MSDRTPSGIQGRELAGQERTSAVMDPGWLFVIAGMALIGCSVLIPAADDLAEARYLRDRAMAIEQQRVDRLTRYEEFIEGIHAQDPTLALSLAASQLNQIPADRSPLPEAETAGRAAPGKADELAGAGDASVYPALEPPPVELSARMKGGSLLERLVLSPKTGLWVGMMGAISVMIGLLPRARRG